MDLTHGSSIHKAYMESLVCPEGQYLVFRTEATKIPRGFLRPLRSGSGGQNEGEDGDGEFEGAHNGEDTDEVSWDGRGLKRRLHLCDGWDR